MRPLSQGICRLLQPLRLKCYSTLQAFENGTAKPGRLGGYSVVWGAFQSIGGVPSLAGGEVDTRRNVFRLFLDSFMLLDEAFPRPSASVRRLKAAVTLTGFAGVSVECVTSAGPANFQGKSEARFNMRSAQAFKHLHNHRPTEAGS
jgi:hypothetical protein